MMQEKSLFEQLKYQNKARARTIYKQKEQPMLKNRNFESYPSTEILIKLRVDEISKEISKKYKVEEEKIYDTLYLKVRKMFMELL